MKLWSSYLKRNLGWIAVILLTIFSMSVIVELNGVHISEWIYGTILCIFFLLVIGGVDFYLYYRRHRNLQKMQEIVKISVNALDMPKDQIEEDYQKLLQLVHEDKVKAVNDLESGRKDMAEDYRNQAIGVFELESECICFVALDAAAKAAAVKIQGVERNRLAAGACVKMRGSVSDVKAAMEAALDVARPLTKIVSHTVIASPSEDTEKAIAMTINK